MRRLSTGQILELIKHQKPFSCIHESEAFSISIDKYSPLACYSIHNGNNMRDEVHCKCSLSSGQRIFEEDPHTKEFIEHAPIKIIAHDSRYEYDLNRDLSECIYDTAWGVKVWCRDLSEEEKDSSIKKHNTFYEITGALLRKLEELFPKVLVFDIHSYNYSRYEDQSNYPVFDLGLCGANRNEFQATIEYWYKLLKNVMIKGYETTVGINQVFHFEGYLSRYVNAHFNNCLIMSTELKKIYCEEKTGEIHHHIFEPLKNSFNENIIKCNDFFKKKYNINS